MASHSRYFLGVDAGGSSVRAIIGDHTGATLAQGTGGPANPNTVGTPAMVAAIKAAVEQAVAASTVPIPSFHAAFFGIAGAASAPDHATFPGLLAALPGLSTAKIEVDHDLRIAHAAALEGRPGIILISGTGSAGFARSLSGEERICGGGGPLIDDVGSGFWIALRALQRAFSSAEDRSPATSLLPAFLAYFKLRHHRELAIATAKLSRDGLAALSPLVFASAKDGDAAAAEIIDEGARELAGIAESLRASLFGSDAVPVSFCGGLSQNSEYTALLISKLAQRSPRFSFSPNLRAPVEGALLLAQRAG